MQIEERKPANSIVESKNHWRDIHPLPLSWFFEVKGFFEQLPDPLAAENEKVRNDIKPDGDRFVKTFEWRPR